jgi:hypothetical protein
MRMIDAAERQPHQVQIRRRSLVVCGVVVPLLIIAIAVWLGFNAVVCQGRTQPWERLICDHGHVIPDVFAALAVATFGWFLFALSSFGGVLQDATVPPGRAVARQLRHARDGYRTLEDSYKATAFLALEMSGWALGVVVTVLIFYWTQYAFPLGLLIIAAFLRVLFALARAVILVAIRMSRGTQ